MKTKAKTTQLQELAPVDLQAINGGAANGAGMTMSSSADSLVSMEFKWQQGDNYRDYKLSAGNGIHVNLDAFANGNHV
ncbi:hypothetical protein [Mucilaginibacter flavus]|uniref:hypothetical protein n=1 Tax=Mucilaginibacter flavus TaxID=931504 RepID=UPI0025B3B2B8|nr:hypothetical protein [Mucilaginibacter flavus]MDN3582074.1 hypothetical protein [Mucilaginibacter flavus]